MAWDTRYPLGARLAQKHLPVLDGLRMVAVLLVLLGHVNIPHVPADLGVSIFFVLSGFLITWLLLNEREGTGTVALGAFYLRRAFRLLPAYYAYLAVAFAFHFRHPGARTDVILPSLLYYANYFNATHNHPPTPISHTWSLAVEEQFYLLWPLAFLLSSRRSSAAVIGFLVVSIVGVGVWRSLAFAVILPERLADPWAYNAFDCRFDNLAAGCLAAVLSKREGFLKLAAKVASRPLFVLFPAASLFALHWRKMPLYHLTVGFTVDAILIAVAIVQLIQLADRPSIRWLDHPVPRYLGTISYPIYLWHGFAQSPMYRLKSAPPPVWLGAYLATAVVLGTVSYYAVEKPFLRLRARLMERRSREAQLNRRSP